MQIYMHLLGLKRALYLAKNKNTDELYSERIKYDKAEAERLLLKARAGPDQRECGAARAGVRCRLLPLQMV